jgi:hypothetical protein
MSLSTNTVYRLFVEKLGGANPTTFVGDEGEVFYNPNDGVLKISDGSTPTGIVMNPIMPVGFFTPPDNHWYVNSNRTDTYTSTGSVAAPYKTVGAALSAIQNALQTGIVSFTDNGDSIANPQFVILQSSTTENIGLTTGHIYIQGDTTSGSQMPIWIYGTVTINPTVGSLYQNRFGLSNLGIVNTGSNPGIGTTHSLIVTGSAPLRCYLNDCNIIAGSTGNQAIFMDNSGTGTQLYAEVQQLSRAGTSGTDYVVKVSKGYAFFSNCSTGGSTATFNVSGTGTLQIQYSKIESAGEACVKVDGGTAIVTSTSLTNTVGHGVSMTAGTLVTINNYFDIPTSPATNRAIAGVSGVTVLHSNTVVAFGKNAKYSTAIGAGYIGLVTALTAT